MIGCAAYQHPASTKPPTFTAGELNGRLHMNVAVQMPVMTQFESIKDSNMRQTQYDLATSHAQRLIEILRDCEVVDSVSPTDGDAQSYAAVIQDLTMNVERTGMDDPMALVYGGVLPVYSKSERGVHFRFLKGGSGEFTFEWTESVVISVWAPLMTVGSSKWETNRKSTTYWYDLRKELLKAFTSVDPGHGR